MGVLKGEIKLDEKHKDISEYRKQRLIDIQGAIRGINLSEKEMNFLYWLSGWDSDTAYNFVSIIEKARAE